jgi:superkiller protein 3
MKIFKILPLVVLCGLLSCGDDKADDIEVAQSVESPYATLNALSKSIANTENEDEKRKLLIKRAHWYLDHRFISDLQADAEKIYKIDSSYAHRNALFALGAMEQGNYVLAKNFVDAALDFENGKDEALYAKAELEFVANQLPKSLETVNDALRENQYHYRAYFLKGKIFLQAGDTAKAVSSIRTAVELNPEFYNGFKMLALAYESADTAFYKEYVNAAARVEPNNAEPLFMLADFHYRNGRISEAKETYKKSLAADSTFEFSHFNLGTIYLGDDIELDSALESFQKCVNIAPNYTNAWYNMGICYEYMDNAEKAIESYSRVLELNPAYQPARDAIENLK